MADNAFFAFAATDNLGSVSSPARYTISVNQDTPAASSDRI